VEESEKINIDKTSIYYNYLETLINNGSGVKRDLNGDRRRIGIREGYL
jgi:hypothetical protein